MLGDTLSYFDDEAPAVEAVEKAAATPPVAEQPIDPPTPAVEKGEVEPSPLVTEPVGNVSRPKFERVFVESQPARPHYTTRRMDHVKRVASTPREPIRAEGIRRILEIEHQAPALPEEQVVPDVPVVEAPPEIVQAERAAEHREEVKDEQREERIAHRAEKLLHPIELLHDQVRDGMQKLPHAKQQAALARAFYGDSDIDLALIETSAGESLTVLVRNVGTSREVMTIEAVEEVETDGGLQQTQRRFEAQITKGSLHAQLDQDGTSRELAIVPKADELTGDTDLLTLVKATLEAALEEAPVSDEHISQLAALMPAETEPGMATGELSAKVEAAYANLDEALARRGITADRVQLDDGGQVTVTRLYDDMMTVTYEDPQTHTGSLDSLSEDGFYVHQTIGGEAEETSIVVPPHDPKGRISQLQPETPTYVDRLVQISNRVIDRLQHAA